VYLGQNPGLQEPADLAELCRGTLANLRADLPPEVALEADLPAPGPVILVNPEQFRQVLGNLVTNAREALPDTGGTIRLGLRAGPVPPMPSARRFPIGWQPSAAPYACLEVSDTGCGMAQADLDKLFDPFFSTKFTGRGLGLPVVLGILQTHGGGVAVESRPDRGSSFRLFFPLAPEGLSPSPAPEAPVAIQAGGTILLVDDDEALLEATAELVATLGFTPLTAKDGLEAVAQFRRHPAGIRCVITDLTMPHMDGWQTLSALRRLAPSLPAVLASGYDQAQVMATDHPDRPQAFLGKPFSLQQLREAVHQALGAGGAVL
jgi:CheY-like chemotaxis protein